MNFWYQNNNSIKTKDLNSNSNSNAHYSLVQNDHNISSNHSNSNTEVNNTINKNKIIKKRSNSNSNKSFLEKIKSGIKLKPSINPSTNSSSTNSNNMGNNGFDFKKNSNTNPVTPYNYNMTPSSYNTPGASSTAKPEGILGYRENIHVFLRVRPLNNMEQSRGDTKCVELANQSMAIFNNVNKNLSRKFSFDYIFGEKSSQEEVFHFTEISVSLTIQYIYFYNN